MITHFRKEKIGRDADSNPDSYLEQLRQKNLTDMQALEEFIVDNSDLDQLESSLQQFNIFESIGMQWQEIRHSAFLAFLLDPKQPHGLSDDFLKKLLQKAFLRNSAAPNPISLEINLVDLHLMNLYESVIERERSNIDVLVVNKVSRLVVIIENKLLSGEHSNQLVKYFEFVKHEFPGHSIIPLFLSIEGKSPSHSNYLPLSYADIAELVSNLIDNRMTSLGTDILILMKHYVQMLRKNILNDTELNELCLKIYGKHKRAFDLIVSRIPDRNQQIISLCKTHLEASGGLEIVKLYKGEVAFIPIEWNVPRLRYSLPKQEGLLQFHIGFTDKGDLEIFLQLRPGCEETRQTIYDTAKKHKSNFKNNSQKLPSKWCRLHFKKLIPKSDLDSQDMWVLTLGISQQLDTFITEDLKRICIVLNSVESIWDKDAPYADKGVQIEEDPTNDENGSQSEEDIS